MLRKVVLVATLTGILLLNVSSIPGQETAPVYAKPALGHAWFYRYNQDFTAYAMGNLYSAAGLIVAGEDAAIRCSNLGGVPGGGSCIWRSPSSTLVRTSYTNSHSRWRDIIRQELRNRGLWRWRELLPMVG
jgi:hypothetical protein